MSFLCLLSLLSSLSWVVVRNNQQVTMHGDMKDIEVARGYLAKFGPGYLWFRQDGRQYVVKDEKVVELIDEAVRPQEALGADQSKLGARQSELGRQQSKLGMRQSQLGQEMARAGARGEGPDRALEEEMQELSRAQQTLGREQEKIGREQQKLGQQQQELSRQVEQKVLSLIEASLKDGRAKPVN